MFRFGLMLVLIVVTLVATPLDAQVFRRFSRRAAARVEPKPTQADRSSQQALRKQQIDKRPQYPPNRTGTGKIAKSPQSSGQIKAKPTVTSSARPQPYRLYYNPQTRQTFLKPIQRATPDSDTAFRRSAVGTRSNVPVQPAKSTAGSEQRNRNNSAAQSQRLSGRLPGKLILNAPLSTELPPAVPVLPESNRVNAQPRVNAAPSTLTSLPDVPQGDGNLPNQSNLAPATPTPADSPTATFSILKSNR